MDSIRYFLSKQLNPGIIGGRSFIESTETCMGLLPYTSLAQNSNIYIEIKVQSP